MISKGLEYFMAVAECKSFIKAAKKLYITPSAVTLQIKALERRLGFTLFNRDNRGTQLTEAGQVFYDDAAKIINQLNTAVYKAQDLATSHKQSFKMGVITSERFFILPFFCHRFCKNHPGIDLTFVQLPDDDVLDALINKRIDICFRYGIEDENYKGIEQTYLYEAPLQCLIPAKHPLSAKEKISFNDLTGETLMLTVPGLLGYYDDLRDYLCKNYPGINIGTSVAVDSALIAMQTMNLLSVCPKLNEPTDDRFVSLPINNKEWSRLIKAKLLYRNPPSDTIRLFISYCLEHIPELTALLSK